jgi:hypothetical protein
MTALKRFLLPALTIFCGACISMNEETFSKQSIDPHQRTIVAIYPSPGPWVVSESESKAESASKVLPLLSSMVQSYQDNRDNTAAADLAQYIPRWSPEKLYASHLMEALAATTFPGRFIPAAESELDTATLRALNQAADTLDWQNKYFLTDSAQAQARDYSKILSLDDAIVYETNILPSIAMDDDGNMIPTLSVLSRLVRCRTGHSLWAHMDTAQNKEAARSMFEFKTLPQALVGRWISLMPTLSLQAANSLRVALGEVPVSTATTVSPPPRPAPQATAISTTTTGSPPPVTPWPSISTTAIPSPQPVGH